MMMRGAHILFLLSWCGTSLGQEICNNGIDDDGNGLVDLSDPTCPCSAMLSSGAPSFIPNPSFEGRDTTWLYVPQLDSSIAIVCCPAYYNLPVPGWSDPFTCLAHWEQATEPTTDFFNACGLYPDAFPIPPPDGVGFVGMRMVDGWQEYVGACLMSPGPPNPLLAGVEYTFTAQVAGTSILNPGGVTQSLGAYYADPIPLALYGSPDCVPFPVNTVGCPVPNGWVELASMQYQANGQWDQVSFTFTPDQDIRTVMFGTGCVLPASFTGGEDSTNYTPYLLLDDLHLTAAVDQVILPVTSTGHVCANNVVVTAHPPAGATSYQWYLNGVALVGRTDRVLNVSALGLGSGLYTFASTYDGGCLMGSTHVAVPGGPDPVAHIAPATGCVPLTVAFADITDPVSMASSWSFGDGGSVTGATATHTYTSPGSYDVALSITTEQGCVRDTTFAGAVVVHPGPVGSIAATPNPAHVDDPVVALSGSGSTGDILSWWWDLGAADPATATGPSLTVTFPAEPGTYPVMLVVSTSVGCVDTVRSVVVVRSDVIEMPNVFSPNSDGHNDRFVPLEYGGAPALLEIYNRWGQLVFSTTALATGWDGRAEGGDVPEGTYYYIVTPDDAGAGTLVGHVTLIR